jgi:hypothetical protein
MQKRDFCGEPGIVVLYESRMILVPQCSMCALWEGFVFLGRYVGWIFRSVLWNLSEVLWRWLEVARPAHFFVSTMNCQILVFVEREMQFDKLWEAVWSSSAVLWCWFGGWQLCSFQYPWQIFFFWWLSTNLGQLICNGGSTCKLWIGQCFKHSRHLSFVLPIILIRGSLYYLKLIILMHNSLNSL